MAQVKGRIILLNGTSSAGKSTIAKELRGHLEPQFHSYSSDQLADAGFRPLDKDVRFKYRESFYEGFHKSIAAFAEVGLDLLVEHIVECQSWADDLKVLLSPFDVFWIGVHVPVVEIERRERLRANRQIGEGIYHLKTHTFCKYDLEVDTTQPLEQNVETILTAWRSRSISRMDRTTG